jgi:hypothetical protein
MADQSAVEGILAVEKEQQVESVEILKAIHKPMRQWFKTLDAAIRKQHGRFPLFWQELKDWPAWAEVYKAYMIATEDKSAGSALRKLTTVKREGLVKQEAGASTAAAAAAGGGGGVGVGGVKTESEASLALAGEAAATSAAAAGDGGAEADGTVAATDGSVAAATDDGTGTDSGRKRKSRWSTEDSAPRTRSRWGGGGAAAAAAGGVPPPPPPPPPAPPKPNLDQMAKMGLVSAENLQIMKLRLKMTELDNKLRNVQYEAAALAADPNSAPPPPPETGGAPADMGVTAIVMRLTAQYTKEKEEVQGEIEKLGGPSQDSSATRPRRTEMMSRKLYVTSLCVAGRGWCIDCVGGCGSAGGGAGEQICDCGRRRTRKRSSS